MELVFGPCVMLMNFRSSKKIKRLEICRQLIMTIFEVEFQYTYVYLQVLIYLRP